MYSKIFTFFLTSEKTVWIALMKIVRENYKFHIICLAEENGIDLYLGENGQWKKTAMSIILYDTKI